MGPDFLPLGGSRREEGAPARATAVPGRGEEHSSCSEERRTAIHLPVVGHILSVHRQLLSVLLVL